MVRVRFAPSPTGPLHIGGVRTALYNFLFAKKNNGTLILRIEDTDSNRFVDGAQEYIEKSFDWCGISFDESPSKGGKFGPYIQSQRNEIYNKYINEIIKTDNVYYAFDTQEELDEIRQEYEKQGKVFSYNSSTRKKLKNSLNLSQKEVQDLLDKKSPYVIRFKTPENRILILNDVIRGDFSIDTNTLDDKVLIKTDGIPTYHFANIIDDHLMEISHVIRGEEWLSSLALHYLLYESFGWKPPVFAHLPLLLKPEGNGKLSKRDGDKFGFPVFPLEWINPVTNIKSIGYKEEGYFPEAFINMLVVLGWTPKDNKEILSINEIIQEFELEKVHKSGAKFNVDKNKWFNKEYLMLKSNEELLPIYQEILKKNDVIPSEKDLKIIQIIKERVHFVNEIFKEASYFYKEPETLNEKDLKKVWKEDTQNILNNLINILQNINWNEEEINNTIKEYSKTSNIGLGKILAPIRLKLVGELKGADVPLIMEIIGKEETIKRIIK